MILDFLVGFILLVSILIGLLRGLIREILTLIGVAGGVVAAWIGGPHLAPILQDWMGFDPTQSMGEETPKLLGILPYELAADLLAWTILFVVVVAIIMITSHYLSLAANAAGLGLADKILGSAFGLVRGTAIVLVLYMPIHVLADAKIKHDWFSTSITYTALEAAAAKMLPLIPANLLPKPTEDIQEEIKIEPEEDKKNAEENGFTEDIKDILNN